MADKPIGQLTAAPSDLSFYDGSELFVLEQNGTAKKLTMQILENWLVAKANGHGGIQSITKTSTSGLVDTYTIVFADETTSSFTVTNGNGITAVTQYWAVSSSSTTVPSSWSTTRQEMTSVNRYLWSYTKYTRDSGSFETPKSVVGVYGDTGDAWYVWIKYAGQEPTSDADMGDTPDDWMGIYSGTSSSAPAHYTSYDWFEIKGDKGDTGNPATISSAAVEYQVSNSGTTVPTGTWTTTVPTVTQGNFLWTRTTLQFNSGNPIVWYAVAYQAVDGTGAPGTATPLMDGTGAAGSSVYYSRQDHVHPSDTSKQDTLVSGTNIKTVGGQSLLGSGNIDAGGALYFTSVACSAMTGDFATISNAAITANHVVVSLVFANSSAITTDVTWTTASGSLTLNGTCSAVTTVDIVLVLKNN